MSTVYDFVPIDLQTSSTNIRLLGIVHDDNDSLIRCKLRTVSLRTLPHYTALSYVWGASTLTRDILLDNKPFTVRENLWTFLQQARERQERSLFWIDAICINQADNQERTHQVSMMGWIYSCAALVVVWLGFSSSDMLGLEMAVSAYHSRYHDQYILFRRWLDEHRQQVSRLYLHEYWSRTWVIQEYVLAQKLVIWIGAQRLESEHIESIFSCIQGLMQVQEWRIDDATRALGEMSGKFDGEFPVEESQTCDALLESPAMQLIEYRSRRHVETCMEEQSTISISSIVTLFGHTHCADPRDHVYALLSLCNERMVPDYSISAYTLFSKLVRMAAEKRSPDDLEHARSEERYVTLRTLGWGEEKGVRISLLSYAQFVARLLEIEDESWTLTKAGAVRLRRLSPFMVE
jgi:hypothetical protein